MNTLSTLLTESVAKFPDKIALVIGNHSYTYQKLDDLTRRLANSFIKQGIKPGDCIAFLLPNSLEIILCYYACFRIGAIAVPVNSQFNQELILYVVKQSTPRIFITTSDYYKDLPKDHIGRCYLISGAIAPVKDFQELLLSEPLTQFPTIEAHQPALIFFTSGTTGLPKAVVHTHHSLIQGTKNQIAQIQMNHRDKTLVMFPVCYLIGLGSQILTYHAVGATVVLLPRFESKEALTQLQTHQITKIYGFPKLYLELINCAELLHPQINTLNFCFSGGEATPISLQERFNSLFHIEITEGCGMSELQIYSMNHPYGAKKIGSIGYPISGMELRLIDEQNKVISIPNTIGELIVRGESMCAGYWQDPSLTKKVIKKGWFHTGDLAYRDNEGCYWFVSRKVDIIRHGDELISPLGIEHIFYQHPAVKEAAAIGLANPEKPKEDQIIVYVVLKDNKINTEQLMDFACKALPLNQHPKQIIILEQLPYGFTGKIDRNALRMR
jgi:long-chain acyl-CoA synthetase